ncbi:MAG: CDP-diacylglycerol--serine O-phosphatidyltransferase [Elusimicrobia bacterium]|nr:CDP-diacylglycerol--serine O-phosphatidyltransferase [Elusimicrobiota bacterium]
MEIKRPKRKSAAVAPSLLTVGNMGCGFLSLLYAGNQRLDVAAWLILAAVALDILDGRVARFLKGESSFGIEFDSLADWISFGVAPAFLMYRFVLIGHGVWGFIVSFLFALAGAFRLARFNLIAHSGDSMGTYFVGLPIPAAGGVLASFVSIYDFLEKDISSRSLRILMEQVPLLYSLSPVIVLGLALLMVSRVPYSTFKQSDLLRPRSLKSLLVILAGLSLVYVYPRNALFIFFSLYVLSGWVGYFRRNH